MDKTEITGIEAQADQDAAMDAWWDAMATLVRARTTLARAETRAAQALDAYYHILRAAPRDAHAASLVREAHKELLAADRESEQARQGVFQAVQAVGTTMEAVVAQIRALL